MVLISYISQFVGDIGQPLHVEVSSESYYGNMPELMTEMTIRQSQQEATTSTPFAVVLRPTCMQ